LAAAFKTAAVEVRRYRAREIHEHAPPARRRHSVALHSVALFSAALGSNDSLRMLEVLKAGGIPAHHSVRDPQEHTAQPC
jgi:hypothetical protein